MQIEAEPSFVSKMFSCQVTHTYVNHLFIILCMRRINTDIVIMNYSSRYIHALLFSTYLQENIYGHQKSMALRGNQLLLVQ